MSPMLSRLYKTPGGTEALDVLMKYMYAALPQFSTASVSHPWPPFAPAHDELSCTSLVLLIAQSIHSSLLANGVYSSSYKGMAHTSAASTTPKITPQTTGFSQVHSSRSGEGGGQAMSVLLSWHEKVQSIFPSSVASRCMSWPLCLSALQCPAVLRQHISISRVVHFMC